MNGLYKIAVVEDMHSGVARCMEAMHESMPNLGALLVTKVADTRCLTGHYDFIAVSGSLSRTASITPHEDVSCAILLVPGRCATRAVKLLSPECIIDYGMSGRDTITLSSIEEKKAVVALQRELITIEKTVLERQEIPIEFSRALLPEQLMVIAGSLLIMGVEAGEPLKRVLASL